MKSTKNTRPIMPEFVSALGNYLFDSSGNRYFDLSAQTFNLILGHRNKVLDDAVIHQINSIGYLSSRYETPIHHQALAAIGRMVSSEFTTSSFKMASGSLANEHALKAVRKKTGKEIIFSLEDGYHGQSFETMRISGKVRGKNYLGDRSAEFFPTPNCIKCPFGKKSNTCNVECLGEFEERVEKHSGNVAAFIVEPIMVEAGVIILLEKYIRKLRSLCTQFNMALIFDEVQTAGGWLETYTFTGGLSRDIHPDIITFGKAISGGYPLAAVVMREEYDVLEYGEHEFTYGGALIGLSAFVQLEKIVQSIEFKNSFRRTLKVLEKWIESVKNLDNIFTIRGMGMIYAIVLSEKCTMDREKLKQDLLESKLVARTTISAEGRTCIVLKIPPIVSSRELEKSLKKLEKHIVLL